MDLLTWITRKVDKYDENPVKLWQISCYKNWSIRELNNACYLTWTGSRLFISLSFSNRKSNTILKHLCWKQKEAFAAMPNEKRKKKELKCCTRCHWNCWCACQYVFKKAQQTYCSAHTFNGIYFDKYSFNIHKYINKKHLLIFPYENKHSLLILFFFLCWLFFRYVVRTMQITNPFK